MRRKHLLQWEIQLQFLDHVLQTSNVIKKNIERTFNCMKLCDHNSLITYDELVGQKYDYIA